MTRMPEFERDALRADRRRFAAEERQVTRMERREQAAKPWIGELCREGRIVYYTQSDLRNPRTYREHDTYTGAVMALVRAGVVK